MDLYYRIAGIDVRLPSLKERASDIPALSSAFLKRMSRAGIPSCRLTDDAMEKLMGYAFPGNVRELRNILLKAVAACNHGIISAAHIHLGNQPLHHHVHGDNPPAPVVREEARGSALAEIEAHHIAELLAKHEGHRRNAADALGISERTLYRKLKRYGLG
jgi:DNA-binding NtrC family response regulator